MKRCSYDTDHHQRVNLSQNPPCAKVGFVIKGDFINHNTK